MDHFFINNQTKNNQMDTADLAFTEIENAIKLSAYQGKKEPKLLPIGVCYNCEAEVTKNKLFCDNYCADDYDKYVKTK